MRSKKWFKRVIPELCYFWIPNRILILFQKWKNNVGGSEKHEIKNSGLTAIFFKWNICWRVTPSNIYIFSVLFLSSIMTTASTSNDNDVNRAWHPRSNKGCCGLSKADSNWFSFSSHLLLSSANTLYCLCQYVVTLLYTVLQVQTPSHNFCEIKRLRWKLVLSDMGSLHFKVEMVLDFPISHWLP